MGQGPPPDTQDTRAWLPPALQGFLTQQTTWLAELVQFLLNGADPLLQQEEGFTPPTHSLVPSGSGYRLFCSFSKSTGGNNKARPGLDAPQTRF